VEQALRLGIRLLNAEVANLAFGDALARLNVGVFLLDQEGRIVLSNPLAQELSGDALLTSSDRLTARYAPEREALDRAIDLASSGEALEAALKPVLVHGLDPETFLAVYVSPARLPTGHVAEQLLTEVRTAVVAIAARKGEPADPAIVRDILGLTLGEARLAALVGSGLPPRESAERLGITEETARTTLKRVFAKVGVSRQSELAALLSRLVLR
jgi:DNA-binding CsgD family transcriptional regulator